jgi:hypothetical protein
MIHRGIIPVHISKDIEMRPFFRDSPNGGETVIPGCRMFLY